MDLSQVKTELGSYWRKNVSIIRGWVYKEADIIKYLNPLTKVKGKYPAFHIIMGHLVQGFQAEWAALGTVKIKANQLQSFHHKVNVPIVPSEVEGSWLAELNNKNLTPIQRPISQYIMEMAIKPAVIQDIEELLIDGVYDEDRLDEFGFSMNGLKEVLRLGKIDTSNPMYRMLLSAVPTADNIVDVVLEFEQKIPRKLKKKLTRIYMDQKLADDYWLKFNELYGAHFLTKEQDAIRTRLRKLEIVALDMEGSTDIFTTPNENFLLLTDDLDGNGPKITDIQIQDYTVKIFMEWFMGIGFWTNQMVLVSQYTGEGSGLASGDEDTELYMG